MCHVPDGCPFHDTSPATGLMCATGWRAAVRGFCRNGRRDGGNRIRCGAAWSWGGPRAVGAGPGGAARDRAALSARAWAAQAADADAAFPAARCPDRGRGGVALQGAGGGGRRNPGRSCGIDLHRDEAAGFQGRGDGCALLADPAGGDCRSQRGARPLAHRTAAIGRQRGRSARAGRSALAAGTVPLARRTAGGMGGPP